MKKYFFILVISLFTVNLFSQINQDWKWQHPFPQGNIIRYTKVVDAQNWVMVGEAGTFIKTTNGGQNFIVTHAAGTPTTVGNMQSKPLYNGWFFDANTGMVCGFLGYFARTTNGGQSWDTTISTGVTANLYGIHFLNSSTGYMCGSSAKVLKTTNAGLNWTLVPVSGFTTGIYNIYALDTNNIFASLTNSRAYAYTTNAGTNWYYTPATFGLSFAQDVNFINQSTGFICGNAGKFYYTTNSGLNWIANNTVGTNTLYHILTDTSNGGTIYVTGDPFYIFKRTFTDTSWTNIPFLGNSQMWTSQYFSLDKSANVWLSAGGQGLINVSTNDGLNWSCKTFMISAGPRYDIWSDIPTGKAITVGALGAPGANDQVMITSNGGTNWSLAAITSSSSIRSISMIDIDNGFICGSNGEIQKTTNGGNNWILLSSDIPSSENLYDIQFLNSSTGWTFSNSYNTLGTVFKTTNGGINWVQTLLAGTDSTRITSAYMIDANTGWVISNLPALTPRPYKTTNGGSSWTRQDDITGSWPVVLNNIQMLNVNTGYIVGGYSTANLIKTTNGGTNWFTIPLPFTTGYNDVHFVNENTGIIAGNTSLVLQTTNGGNTWQFQNANDGNLYGAWMFSNGMSYVVGTGPTFPHASVFKNSNTFTSSNEYSAVIPLNYILEQNYPNPFNPVTNIKFALPKVSVISLKIYDLTGREVSSIIDNQSLNAGTFTYKFDGNRLSSGIYFYVLKADGKNISTKKMMLIK